MYFLYSLIRVEIKVELTLLTKSLTPPLTVAPCLLAQGAQFVCDKACQERTVLGRYYQS